MSATNVMNRYDATLRLLERIGPDDAIVGGIGNTNFDLWAAGPRNLNFYMLGSMGLAVPIALGVAIAQPSRRVIALEGDGSILMQLGVLTTVAKLGPGNLGTIVMDNGCYQITGSQPTATARYADLSAIATGSGLRHSVTVSDAEGLDGALDSFLPLEAPWLIVVKIDGDPPRGTTERDPLRIRTRFMDALKLA
jgi:thiamine pyrophosphate-dependent acetolactate synthase large subunit-like protein